MFFIGIFVCVVIAVVLGIVIPKKENTKLDKIGFIFNIILSVLYVPMSLYGIFSLFAADVFRNDSKSDRTYDYYWHNFAFCFCVRHTAFHCFSQKRKTNFRFHNSVYTFSTFCYYGCNL